jgi:hypothetical protein
LSGCGFQTVENNCRQNAQQDRHLIRFEQWRGPASLHSANKQRDQNKDRGSDQRRYRSCFDKRLRAALEKSAGSFWGAGVQRNAARGQIRKKKPGQCQECDYWQSEQDPTTLRREWPINETQTGECGDRRKPIRMRVE